MAQQSSVTLLHSAATHHKSPPPLIRAPIGHEPALSSSSLPRKCVAIKPKTPSKTFAIGIALESQRSAIVRGLAIVAHYPPQ